MPGIPVDFMGKIYKSKTDFCNYIREIIYSIGVCDSIKENYSEYYEIC